MADGPPGYVYDDGWRAVHADGRRTRPYTTIEAAARALVREAFEDLNAPPIGWYPIPRAADVDRCKSCSQRIVWTRTEIGRMMPLSLQEVRIYGGRKYAASHFSDCEHAKQWSTAKRGSPPPRQSNRDTRPAGRTARPVASYEDDE